MAKRHLEEISQADEQEELEYGFIEQFEKTSKILVQQISQLNKNAVYYFKKNDEYWEPTSEQPSEIKLKVQKLIQIQRASMLTILKQMECLHDQINNFDDMEKAIGNNQEPQTLACLTKRSRFNEALKK